MRKVKARIVIEAEYEITQGQEENCTDAQIIIEEEGILREVPWEIMDWTDNVDISVNCKVIEA